MPEAAAAAVRESRANRCSDQKIGHEGSRAVMEGENGMVAQ